MNKRMTKILISLTFVILAAGMAVAQTETQNVIVTIRPATTVEERVANEMKEKALRKEAEERLAAEAAARLAKTNPRTLLADARTLFISSDTKFFEEAQLQNALRSRTEMTAWNLMIVDGWANRDSANLFIEIDRPLFTYTFTYEILDHKTGIVLATGKVTAFDGNAAAPKLAEKIIEEIRTARGEARPKE